MQMVLAAAVVMGISAPRQARAEGYINPWAGVVFGNDQAEKKFGSFGVAVGDAGHIVGFEANLGYAPDFFDEAIDNSVLDLMGNLVIGPMAGNNGYGVRPFVTGGLGVIRTAFEDDSNTDLGFNVGGGIFAYFSPRVGVRGTVRYFRTLNADEDFHLDTGEFHYWRAELGITIH
jgi:hypothetical protein